MLRSIGQILCTLVVIVFVSRQAMAQPAPNLRVVQVVAVKSSGYSQAWDYTRGAVVPPKDHRGPELLVVTFDDGYAVSNSPKAKFLGLAMREVLTKRYPNTGPILGYYRYWYISTPFTSGNFSYEATSINSLRRLGTSIQIR